MKTFISYRRNDSLYLAAQVRDTFVAAHGPTNVFFDVASIPIATDFSTHIRQWIEQADVLVALIGPRWDLERIADESDDVRMELCTARRMGKVVVPVLHSGCTMPSVRDLPGELGWLSRLNALPIGPPPGHVADLHRLVSETARIVGSLRPHLPDPPAPQPRRRFADLDQFSNSRPGAPGRRP